MRKLAAILLILATVAGAVSARASAQSTNVTYHLRSIGGEISDSIQCLKDGGMASLVATIGEDGQLSTPWTPYCLLKAN